MKRFTISVLTYTALEHSRRCVQSILENSGDGRAYDLILTANGNPEAAKFFHSVARKNKNVRVVVNDKNLGFIEPNKAALSMTETPFFCLCNDDAIIPPGWLEKLEAPFLSDPLCALSGPVGGRFQFGPQNPLIQWLEGSCIMGRTKQLKEVGLFSDYLKFACWEEVDLGFRLIERGHTLHLTPFDIGHAGKMTRSKIPNMAAIERNNLKEVRRRFPQYFK